MENDERGSAAHELTDAEAFRLMRRKVRPLTDEEKAALKAYCRSKLPPWPRELSDVGVPIDDPNALGSATGTNSTD